MKQARLWQAYLVGSLTVVIAYFLLPTGGLHQAALYMGSNLAVMVALVVGVIRYRPAKPLVWRVLLSGQVLYLIATFFWYPYPILRKAELAFPGPHDPLFILAYLLEAAALALLIRSRSGGRNRADLIDASIVALGMGVLLWELQIDRALIGTDLGPLATVVTVAYPLLDLVLFALVVRLVVGAGRQSPALRLVGLAVTSQLLGDIGYAETALRGSFHYGSFISAGYLLSFVFLGAAALHPSMKDLARPGTEKRSTTLRRRLPFMAMAALIGPFVILAPQVGGEVNVAFIVIVTSVIFLLILARISDLMVDVAEHERVQEQLSRLAVIVESTDDAVIGWSTDGTFTSWNAGATKLYGYEAHEALGQPFAMILPPNRLDEAGALMRRLLAGEQVGHFESERVHKDGTVIDVSLTLSAIRDLAGTVVGGATIARDITAAKRTEADLAVARDEALDASRMKSEFLATMSHEIRTPMNGVIGLTGLLLTTTLDDRQRQYAEAVRSAGDALLSVINDVLDFSKIEAGKLELETADFDVRQVVEEVAALVAGVAQAKGLELLSECDPRLPGAVSGDAGRLRQILVNLAANAVKFTEQGEVVLRATVVSAGEGGVVLRLEVQDTGIGIGIADQHRLFEPFSQADASTTRRYGGTGLGLAICNQLVAAMGGDLGLDSEPGRGSTFWFEVPLGLAARAADPVRPDVGLLDGLPVLIVDDNATNRHILENQLRSWGVVPSLCADGPSGLRHLREAAARGTPFRLALLDMYMADMNGLELANAISSDPGLSFTSLMLLTSTAGVGADEAYRARIATLLTKPVRQSQLYDAMVELLAPSAASAPGFAVPTAAVAEGRGHVLVVEDNLTNQMVALGILSSLGWTADVVANGLEAMEAAGRGDYAALLMDCQMPEMDGYTATAEIRRREAPGRRVPIIAMTASAVDGDRERCLAAGMDDYIAKPVTPEAVAAALDRWTGGGRATTAAPAANPVRVPVPEGTVDQHRLQLLRRMGPADGSLFTRLVDAFLGSGAADLPSMREAVDRGDSSELQHIAHRLRGAAANVGALSLARLCEELEGAGKSGELSSAAPALDRAEDELVAVSTALRAACQEPHR